MKQVILTLGPGQRYAMHGDKVRPGDRFRLRVEVMRSIGPLVGGAHGLAPWTLVDHEVAKAQEPAEEGHWIAGPVPGCRCENCAGSR